MKSYVAHVSFVFLCMSMLVFSLKSSLLFLNAFMEMPLLISVNLLSNISLVEIFGHNKKIFSVKYV